MSKEIRLTRGMVTVVDDEDFNWLSQWTWNVASMGNIFYAERRLPVLHGGKIIRMHRLILGASPGEEVDHVDHDGLNNTRENLRICTHAENKSNSRKPVTNTSGYKGVSYDRGKWKAQISVNDRTRYIGRFNTALEAALAYDEEAVKHYGRFANLNLP